MLLYQLLRLTCVTFATCSDGNGTCHLEVWDNQGSLDLPNWTKTVASHRLKNGKVTSLKLMGLPSKKSDSAVGLSDSVGGRGVRLTLNLHGETHRRMRSIVVVGLDSGLTMCLDRLDCVLNSIRLLLINVRLLFSESRSLRWLH